MSIWLYALIWNLIIWLWIIITFFILKKIKGKINLSWNIDHIIAFTVWLLLWIVFLWFLPELFELSAQNHISWSSIGWFILAGLIIFYILELVLHWHHCWETWEEHCKEHSNFLLMAISTLIHNTFHGIVLYGVFSISIPFGIIITIAILIHSIPQNIATYLLANWKEKIAYIWALGWILWVLILYPFQSFILNEKYAVLALISWFLLYTALTDILPEIMNKAHLKKKIFYLLFILLWIWTFLWIESTSHFVEKHKNILQKK